MFHFDLVVNKHLSKLKKILEQEMWKNNQWYKTIVRIEAHPVHDNSTGNSSYAYEVSTLLLMKQQLLDTWQPLWFKNTIRQVPIAIAEKAT